MGISVAVVGVPVLLIVLLGPPIQSGDGGAAVARAVVSLILWVAWAHFLACLIAEWRAEVRGSGLAPRVPFGGVPQAVARRLVVTALLLSGTTALVVPVTYSQATATATRARPAAAPRAVPPSAPPPLAPAGDGAFKGVAGAPAGHAEHHPLDSVPVVPPGLPGATAQQDPEPRRPAGVGGAVGIPDHSPGSKPTDVDSTYLDDADDVFAFDDSAFDDGLPDGAAESAPFDATASSSTGTGASQSIIMTAGSSSDPYHPAMPAEWLLNWPSDRPELVSPVMDQHRRLLPGDRVVKLYEVRPAEGRHHDTLWGIAERFLGDGLRYREIFDLNEGRAQPDGRTLSKPSLIHAGWVLLLPADAQGDGLRVLHVPDSADAWAAPAGSGEPPAEVDEDGLNLVDYPQGHLPPPDAAELTRPAGPASRTSWPHESDTDGESHNTTEGSGAVPTIAGALWEAGRSVTEPTVAADVDDEVTEPWVESSAILLAPEPTFLGIASAGLLAAGVLAALAERRGSAAPAPDEAEQALLLAADPEAARFVDRSLRTLAEGLTAQGRLLPPVYAAILTDQTMILHMAPPDTQPPPEPWSPGDVPGSWRIDRTPGLLDNLPEDLSPSAPNGVPAPFPALVTFGHDDAGSRILVDIEGAPGVISLLGDRTVAMRVAVALALELATNMWSDDLRVCFVGFPPEAAVDDLVDVAPERLWTAANVGYALDELSGPDDEEAGDDADDDFPLEAGQRIAGNPGALAPDLLILAQPTDENETARLARMARGRRHAIGVVTIGDSPAARWRFTVDPDRRMSLGVLGVDVWAQCVTTAEYRAIADLFRGPPPGQSPASDHSVMQPPLVRPADGTLVRPSVPEAGPQGPQGDGPSYEPPSTPAAASAVEPTTAQGSAGQTYAVDDDITRPPARQGSVPGVVPWTPSRAGSPTPPSSVGDAQSRPRDVDATRPPADGHRHPAEPPPTPSHGPFDAPRQEADEAGAAASPLMFTQGQPRIRPTDIPRVPPVLYFETPRMRASRESGASATSIDARQTAGAAPPTATPPTVTPTPARPLRPAPSTPGSDPVAPVSTTPAPAGRYGTPPERVATPARPTPPARPSVLPPNEVAPPSAFTAPRPAAAGSAGKPGIPSPPGRAAGAGNVTGPAQPSSPAGSYPTYSDGEPTIPDRPRPAGPSVAPGGSRPVHASHSTESEATGEAQVRILGTPTVEAPGRQPAVDLDLLTEIVVYLALHREGAEHQQLVQEISFAGTDPGDGDAVRTALERVRRWVGVDGEGRPRLAVGPEGYWRLSADVRCDWELFVAYSHRADMVGSDTEVDLTTALRMVSGPLWTGLPADRYRWATTGPIARSTRAGVIDVAHRLAVLTLGFGDTMTAMAACRTGLRAVPASEVLWRDLLRTVAARGDRRTLEAVVTEMYRTISAGGSRRGGRAEAETDALVQTLLPGFRRARR
jgi:hypothetical protein